MSDVRITTHEYERLAEAGAFTGQRVELIDGLIVRRATLGTPHKWAMVELNEALTQQVRRPFAVSVQCPLRISEISEPEPDFVIFRRPDDRDEDFTVVHASLVIEVSDSSRVVDLGPKARLYAAAGVAEYWVLDLQKEQLVVHRAPKAGRYTAISRHGKTKTVTSLREPRVTVKVAEVLR